MKKDVINYKLIIEMIKLTLETDDNVIDDLKNIGGITTDRKFNEILENSMLYLNEYDYDKMNIKFKDQEFKFEYNFYKPDKYNINKFYNEIDYKIFIKINNNIYDKVKDYLLYNYKKGI